jgi:hypothetical protein
MNSQEMTENNNLICGVMMPISSIGGCPESHWKKVRKIVFKAIENAGFNPQLVSDGENVEVILKRIIHNLYYNSIVVCDISAHNPNVLFELGIRMAFGKPVIIIKDEMTIINFDINPFEYLEYDRDLNSSSIKAFVKKLSDKITGTYNSYTTDPEYQNFIDHFGKPGSTKFAVTEIPIQESSFDESKFLKSILIDAHLSKMRENILKFVVPTYKMNEFNNIERAIKSKDGVVDVTPSEGTNRVSFNVTISDDADRNDIAAFISGLLK